MTMNLRSVFVLIGFVTGVSAAVFWFLSAAVPVPKEMFDTTINERGSITDILRRQANLSKVAAVLTGASILAQALASVL